MPRKSKEEIFIPFRPIVPRNDTNTNRRRKKKLKKTINKLLFTVAY